MNYYEKELNIIQKSNRLRKRKLFDQNLIDLASNDYLGFAISESIFDKTRLKINDSGDETKFCLIIQGFWLFDNSNVSFDLKFCVRIHLLYDGILNYYCILTDYLSFP